MAALENHTNHNIFINPGPIQSKVLTLFNHMESEKVKKLQKECLIPVGVVSRCLTKEAISITQKYKMR